MGDAAKVALARNQGSEPVKQLGSASAALSDTFFTFTRSVTGFEGDKVQDGEVFAFALKGSGLRI